MMGLRADDATDGGSRDDPAGRLQQLDHILDEMPQSRAASSARRPALPREGRPPAPDSAVPLRAPCWPPNKPPSRRAGRHGCLSNCPVREPCLERARTRSSSHSRTPRPSGRGLDGQIGLAHDHAVVATCAGHHAKPSDPPGAREARMVPTAPTAGLEPAPLSQLKRRSVH